MVANWGGDVFDDGREDGFDIEAGFGGDEEGSGRVELEGGSYLGESTFGVGMGKVDFVDDRDEGEALGEGKVEVCNGLGCRLLLSVLRLLRFLRWVGGDVGIVL